MRGKANLASRLQCVLLLLVVARTAAAGGIIYVDANATGANNGSSWENAYVYFIEFPQYPDLFAYDTMKAGSLRRYFDGLTVLHIAYR
ncbi:MAG: hypothetical protein WBC05_20805 [Sedimentisphaerales bacterium]